jgi:hypothetical protein
MVGRRGFGIVHIHVWLAHLLRCARYSRDKQDGRGKHRSKRASHGWQLSQSIMLIWLTPAYEMLERFCGNISRCRISIAPVSG